MTINNGKAITSTRRVKLSIRADDLSPGSGAVEMRLKNSGGDPWTEWRTYAAKIDWKLSEGEEQKVVYVQFKDHAGNKSDSVKATITLRRRVGGGGKALVLAYDKAVDSVPSVLGMESANSQLSPTSKKPSGSNSLAK